MNINNRTSLSGALNRKVKVYDVSKKELIYEFNSAYEAQNALGVKNITSYITNKCKCYKNNLGIVLCFR
jgi:hypothetical protein